MPFKLTPEAQARVAEGRALLAQRQAHYGSLSDGNLVASAKLCMSNMQPINHAPGEPVYDATMWHVILPELLRRLSERS